MKPFLKVLSIAVLLFSKVTAQENWQVGKHNNHYFFLTTEIQNGKIIGRTRPLALKEAVGGINFFVVKTFTKLKYPELVHFIGTQDSSGSGKFRGKYYFLFSSYHFECEVKSDSIFLDLLLSNGRKQRLSGVKIPAISPKRDYPEVVNEILSYTEGHLYNQKFLKTAQWAKFKKRLNQTSLNMKDDLELQIAFYSHARKFPFSHYDLLPQTTEPAKAASLRTYATLEEADGPSAILKIPAFLDTRDHIDSLIDIIESKQYKTLVIDLRNNTGGNFESAFPLAEYIIREPAIAGVFPNKTWYAEFDKLPIPSDYEKFSEFTGGTLDHWYKTAAQGYGAYFKILPSSRTFKGKIYILTNGKTASTCEPLVYSLKAEKYATIIGEPTAGAMLSSFGFGIDQNLRLVIPLNDYITYSGERIDRTGVKPDIEVASEKALEYVLEKIKSGN